MNATLRRIGLVVLGISLGLGLPLSASAQDTVASAIGVRVKPGQLDAYLARVKKLQGVMTRLKIDGNIEAWQVTAGGQTTGTTAVVLEYPNLAAYAESTTKTQADAEFQKLIDGLDDVRTLQSSSLYRQVSGPGSAGDIATGSVLQTVSVRVKPGRLDDYVAKVEALRKISERLGTSNTMRVWQATVAGEATGTVVVGVIYKDLTTYAADTTKVQGDDAWQKLVAGLDEMRTIVSIGLARNVGPSARNRRRPARACVPSAYARAAGADQRRLTAAYGSSRGLTPSRRLVRACAYRIGPRCWCRACSPGNVSESLRNPLYATGQEVCVHVEQHLW
jgi:hypothetical protein